MAAPILPSVPPFAVSSTTNREYIESTTANIVDTVFKIVKEVSETFKDVPYIKIFTGIIIQIISIREEIKTEKDRCKELVDKILHRSKVILDGLRQVESSSNRDRLKDIEGKLNDYNGLLGEILAVLKTHASKKILDRFFNRKSRLGNLEKYDRLVNDFNTDFVTHLHIQSYLAIKQPTSPPFDIVYYKPILPPPSEIMIGRDEEKSKVLNTLLDKTPARIAILGAGGMGKTTLALSSLHDPAVVERFPSRYFVPCEVVTSASGLVREIANGLRIPPAKRDEHLIDLVLSSFHGNAVICLDNFETIWDNESARSEVESFLSHLNRLPQLAIIVTMRGSLRPSRVSWSKPMLPPLARLSDANSKLIFETIGGKVDSFVEKLLKAIDGIPLAVTLVSALMLEGNETSESLWLRWGNARTSVVESGGMDRLSNLDTSIHLSVHGPRMQADPNTISILAMLSVLPGGFPFTEAIDGLQRHLPDDNDLRQALLTMRRVSLLALDEANNPPRLRMLSPVRDFCERRLETPETLRSGLTSFYTEMINNFVDVTDSAGHATIPAELDNMHAVFVETCKRRTRDDTFVNACIGYTKWAYYTGNPVEDVLCLAMQDMVSPPSLVARCHSTLADVYFACAKVDEAQISIERAILLHRQTHDVLGEANNHRTLGDVHLRRDKLDEAQSSFETAILLHKQAHDVLGEANDLMKLGEVYLRRSRLDEAQLSFETAILLHRQAHDVLGEANDLQSLGEVHLRRSKLDEAQSSFKTAILLHRQAHDVLGEAYDLQNLGQVHLRRDKLDEAQSSFETAILLHRQAHHVLGEANDLLKLGEVYLRRSMLDEAQSSFQTAILLHRQAHDVLGEANDLQSLGEVHLRLSMLDEAQSSFEAAILLHRQAHDVLGEAYDLVKLGEVYLRRSKLDEAQSSFQTAILLHRQAHSVLGEANDLQSLGEVHLRRDKLDEAQSSFQTAILLHRQAHNVLGEANDLLKLGDVYLRRSMLDEAQSSFEAAILLHRQAHDVLGEANDLLKLGEVYLRRSMLDEAQSFFESAIPLHRQAHSVLGEANTLQNLGKAHLRRDKLDEARSSFESAILLHRQAHSVLGEANDVTLLGKVHLCQDRFVEARESFEKALALYQQAHSILGEANTCQNLGDLYLRQDNLHEAEVSLNRALLLHRQSQASSNEAVDLRLIQQLSVRKLQLSQ